MSRRGTPFQRWQLAGCPTIPQRFYPHVGYFAHLHKQSQARQAAEEKMKQMYKAQAGPQKGWLHRVKTFFRGRP